MILVIGGAYQGKLDYVKETYGLTDEDVFTCEEGSTAVGFDEKVVDHFERYVLALIKAGQVPEMGSRHAAPRQQIQRPYHHLR